MAIRHPTVIAALPGLALGIIALSTPPAFASRWVEVGTAGVTLDKVMVDLDSVQVIDGFRVVNVMTLYGAPRTNSRNITMDRFVQRTAFDCGGKMFVGIRGFGFIGEKQVGSSPETADWRSKLHPIGDNPMNSRALAAVCAASAPGAPAAAQRPRTVMGSGIIVDQLGSVLTANHVVQQCKSISVETLDSKLLQATLVGTDPKNDLAILKVTGNASPGEPVHFRDSSRSAKLGESIAVIGYPLIGVLSSEPKATFGQVNSIAGINNDYTLLQISAPVQPGNSGGPVLDESGQVIGVVVGEASLAILAVTGSLPQNVNFAVRGEVAQIFLAARGIKPLTSARRRPLSTEGVAAQGLKSTILVRCSNE